MENRAQKLKQTTIQMIAKQAKETRKIEHRELSPQEIKAIGLEAEKKHPIIDPMPEIVAPEPEEIGLANDFEIPEKLEDCRLLIPESIGKLKKKIILGSF